MCQRASLLLVTVIFNCSWSLDCEIVYEMYENPLGEEWANQALGTVVIEDITAKSGKQSSHTKLENRIIEPSQKQNERSTIQLNAPFQDS